MDTGKKVIFLVSVTSLMEIYVCSYTIIMFGGIDTNSYDMVISMLRKEYLFEIKNEDDINSMYKWIKRHRIQQMVLPCLGVQQCVLKDKIKEDIEKILETKEKILGFLLEINEELSEEPPIFIKGLNAFLHTGRPDTLREMQDIDIFYSDLLFLKTLLIKKGFDETDESCDKHEYCKLYNKEKDIYIEIHSYFPVFYRENHTIDEVLPLSTHEITYSDLKDNTIVKVTEKGKICILNKEMATLISCLHIYKGFVWEPFYQPMFRGEELMEIYFMSIENFDKKLFLNLCEKHCAMEAVLFIKSLLKALFPESNHFDFVYGESESVYKLTNDKIGPWKRSSSSVFFRKIFTYSSLDFLFENEFNLITYGSYNFKDFKAKYYFKKAENDLNVKMVVSDTDKKLVFDFFVNDTLENDDNIFIHFGWENAHIWLNKNKSLNRIFGCAKCVVEVFERSYHVKIIFNNDIGNSIIDKKSFVVTYEHKGSNQSTQILIPIELTL